MAWNRPSDEQSKSGVVVVQRTTRLSRGLFAGAVVVIGAAVVWWCLSDSGGHTATRHAEGPQTKRIKEANIAPTKATASPAPKKAEAAPAMAAEPVVTRKTWKPGMRPPNVPEGEAWKASRTKIHEVRRFNSNDGPSAYHSASEQMLVELFTTEPGDAPRPIADVPAEERKRLVEILLDKNPPTDKDTEHVKMQKEVLAEAKKELQKYIREGGDPDTFFRYYHDQLLKDWHRREDAAEEIRRIAREEKDPELAKMLYKEVNKKLENDGIKRVVIDGNLFKEEK